MTLTRSTFVSDRLTAIEDALSLGSWPDAVRASQDALRASPHDPHALHASGRLFELADRPQDALAQWIHTLSIDPSLSASWSALGTILSRGVPIEQPHQVALLAFAQAHRADPVWLLPAWHMALLYHALGYPEAAQAALVRCGEILRAHGDHPKNSGVVNLHNRAYMHLTLGHWAPGFECYEYRLHDVGHALGDRARTRVPEGLPRWMYGDPPKRLAVFVEQGAGDMFMLLPFVQHLAEQGVEITLEDFPSMFNLLHSRLDAPRLMHIEQDAPLPYEVDAYVWAMSLPGLMWESRADISSAPTLPRPFRRPESINRVAFCWQGSRAHKSDLIRSMPVEALRPLAEFVRAAGLTPVALNPGEPIPDFLDDPGPIDSFAVTAGILDTCVAVVSVDTALVHLAGCMGVPTFACLAALPDWRWGLVGRGLVQWYESVTLVRQPMIGDWASVVNDVQTQLTNLLAPSDSHATLDRRDP